MSWTLGFGIVAILCIIGFLLMAVFDVAKTSGADQEEDEHEQGGI